MIGTGKYDFPGIRKAGRIALQVVLSGTSWGASIIASPFWPIIEMISDWCIEWLTNKGLIIVNVGAIYVNGEFQQSAFDKAFDDAIAKSKAPGLTDAQKKVIDDQVKNAFRAFARIGNT